MACRIGSLGQSLYPQRRYKIGTWGNFCSPDFFRLGENRFMELALIGMQEGILLLLVIVVLFGATKLPQLGQGLGDAIKNFKKAMKDNEIDVTEKRLEEEKKEKLESSSRTPKS